MRVVAVFNAALLAGSQFVGAFQQQLPVAGSLADETRSLVQLAESQESDRPVVESARRQLLFHSVAAVSVASLLGGAQQVSAVTPTGPGDGLLDELPNDALRSYLQYRIALQIFADFLRDSLKISSKFLTTLGLKNPRNLEKG